MASTPYPIPRGKRVTEILAGSGVAVYGPFSFKIFDVEDVEVIVRHQGENSFSVASVVVQKVSGNALDFFTITFPASFPSTSVYQVRGARLGSRSAGIQRGTRLDPDALERELSKIAIEAQETRRDLDLSIKVPYGAVPPSMPEPAENAVIGWKDGQFVNRDPDEFINDAGFATAGQGARADGSLQGLDASRFGLSPLNTAEQNDDILDILEALPGDAPISVPPGNYQSTKGFYDLLNKRFLGPGKIVLGGKAQAPQRVFIVSPQRIPSTDRTQMFDALDKQHIAAYTLVSRDANPEVLPDVYTNFFEHAMVVLVQDGDGGFNKLPNDHAGGRSLTPLMHLRQYNLGGGDWVAINAFLEQSSRLLGATHILANPATAFFNGGIGATGDAAGAYLQLFEFIISDGGLAVGSAAVLNLVRTNSGTDVHQFWNGLRVQSGGSVPVDIGIVGTGLFETFLSSLGIELGDAGAYMTLQRGDGIYFDISGTADPLGIKSKVTDLGPLKLRANANTGVLELNDRAITTHSGWSVLSGINGWIGHPSEFSAPRYRLHLGRVYLSGVASGLVSSGAITGVVVGTLPFAWRPAHKIAFMSSTPYGLSAGEIWPSGDIVCTNAASNGAGTNYIGFDNISFDLD